MKRLNLIIAILIFTTTLYTLYIYAEESQILTSAEILRAVEEYILKQVNFSKEDLLIECKSPLADEHLPAGKIDIQLKTGPNLKFYGFTPVEVIIFIENKVYKSFLLYLDIDVKTRVYMARHWIKRYTPLNSDNIILVETYRSKVPQDAVSCEEDLTDRVVKVAVPKGKIITHSIIDISPCIKNRDLVNVVLETNNLRVTAKAQALMDGRRGDLVKLRSLDSKKEIYGRIIDEKTVFIEMENGEKR